MRREIIRQALGASALDGADAVAAAAVRALGLLFAEVEPLVGRNAVRAMYRRSLHLARASFTSPPSAGQELPGEVLTGLLKTLASLDPEEALRASEALISVFAEVLTSLLGPPLTARLLSSAWGVPADARDLSLEDLQ